MRSIFDNNIKFSFLSISVSFVRIIIGAVAGTVLLLILVIISMFFIVKRLRKSLKFHFSGDEEFEYRTPRSGGSSDPSTSRSLSGSLSDTLYDDMEIHKQNPACVWVPEYEEVVTNTSAL